jgi:hypothetical protein
VVSNAGKLTDGSVCASDIKRSTLVSHAAGERQIVHIFLAELTSQYAGANSTPSPCAATAMTATDNTPSISLSWLTQNGHREELCFRLNAVVDSRTTLRLVG